MCDTVIVVRNNFFSDLVVVMIHYLKIELRLSYILLLYDAF